MSHSLPRVFVVGDSISAGYGPHLEKMLAGRFHYARRQGMKAAMQNLDVPRGANSGNSARCLEYFAGLRDSTGLQADLLLFNCGLHDMIHPDLHSPQRQVEPDAYRENLQQIITVVTQLGPEMIWMRITPVDEAQHNSGNGPYRFCRDVDLYNRIADEVMTSRGIPMIDLYTFTLSLGPPHETLYDGRHFHEAIQRLQAAYIAGYLERWRQDNWRE